MARNYSGSYQRHLGGPLRPISSGWRGIGSVFPAAVFIVQRAVDRLGRRQAGFVLGFGLWLAADSDMYRLGLFQRRRGWRLIDWPKAEAIIVAIAVRSIFGIFWYNCIDMGPCDHRLVC